VQKNGLMLSVGLFPELGGGHADVVRQLVWNIGISSRHKTIWLTMK